MPKLNKKNTISKETISTYVFQSLEIYIRGFPGRPQKFEKETAMSDVVQERNPSSFGSMLFRTLLFASAVTLAIYIPFKYITQFHTISGFYAFLFPMSGLLVIAGIIFAVKPQISCSCGMATRAGIASIATLWIVTGLLCVPLLSQLIGQNVLGGVIASVHMSAQHIFLSSALIAFAFAPQWMTRKLGFAVSGDTTTGDTMTGDTMTNKSIPV